MPERLVTIKVDGKEIEAPEGELLIRVLRDLGIRVPTLCHDERLTPYGGCRLCVVERKDGRGGLLPTCSTPVLPGMAILTDTEEVRESRKRQLQLLIANHRMECPVCDRRGDCRLQDLVYEYGAPEDHAPFEMIRRPIVDNSPVILRDPEKCIVCGKCVRLCEEVQGVAAIGIVNRGLDAVVATHLDQPLDCEFCGQCVNACPVGALILKNEPSFVPVWLREERTTTCSYCSCGCQITTQAHEDNVVKVGGDETAEPNMGKLCAKGWLGWDVLGNEARLTKPLVRRKGKLVETTWDEALDEAVRLIKKAQDTAADIVGIGSPRMTNGDAYAMQRLWRVGIGSPHVTAGPSGGLQAMSDAFLTEPGKAFGTVGFKELRDAELVLVLRGDPTRTHPLVKTELVQGAKQRGQQVVLAHSLSGGLEKSAAKHFVLQPGGEPALVNGLSARIVERAPAMGDALSSREGSSAWLDSLKAWTLETSASAACLETKDIEELADMLTRARRVVVVVVGALGLPGDEIETARAASRLVELIDASEGRSAGLMLLGGRANARGVIDVGLHHAFLPGYRPASDGAHRADVAELWGSVVEGPGHSLDDLVDLSRKKGIGLLYLVGQDPLAGWPRSLSAEEVVAGADSIIVHEAFLTPTARKADVVFPVAILAERRGSLIGLDGVERTLNAVVQPPAPIPQDGDLLTELARRLGKPLPSSEEMDAELRKLVTFGHAGATRAVFDAVEAPVAGERKNGALLLDVSPTLFHSGTTTHRSRNLCELAPLVALRLSAEDAAAHGVRGGELIRVSSDVGETLLRARIDRTVRKGTAVAVPSSRRDGTATPLERAGDQTRIQIRRSE